MHSYRKKNLICAKYGILYLQLFLLSERVIERVHSVFQNNAEEPFDLEIQIHPFIKNDQYLTVECETNFN